MKTRYVPSEELTKLVTNEFRKRAVFPLILQSINPATWICPGYKESFLYHLGLNSDQHMIKHLEDSLYESIYEISMKNKMDGNNFTPITTIDEEGLNSEIDSQIMQRLCLPDQKIVRELNHEFIKYVVQNDGFETDIGSFYQNNVWITFYDKREVFKKPNRTNRATVVELE